MKPIVITNPVSFGNETEIVNQLFDDGLELLHLRKPDYPEQEYHVFIQHIYPQFRSRLVLHQFHSMAKESGINRLHFSEQKRRETTGWKQYSDFILSTSVHSIKDFNALPECFEYAFLSPVFPSISKTGYVSGRDLLREAKDRTNFNTKLVALGGITSENMQIAIENGFNNVALLGAIWGEETPIERYQSIRRIKTEV